MRSPRRRSFTQRGQAVPSVARPCVPLLGHPAPFDRLFITPVIPGEGYLNLM